MLPDDFQPALLPAGDADTPNWWFVFAGGNLLVRPTPGGAELPIASIWPFAKLPTTRRLYLGSFRGQPCHAAEVDASASPPPGTQFEGLRALWTRLDEGLLGVASHAAQLIEWDRTHQFCGRCGTPTQRRADERSRHCAACGLTAYPRLSPVVMVRITRGREILLARAPRFALGVYSVLAGFVEAGETLEQALRREVAEEVVEQGASAGVKDTAKHLAKETAKSQVPDGKTVSDAERRNQNDQQQNHLEALIGNFSLF